jgi:uncharacterized membrane protein
LENIGHHRWQKNTAILSAYGGNSGVWPLVEFFFTVFAGLLSGLIPP